MTTNDSTIVINQRYKIIELISQGAFGLIYKVEDNYENNKTWAYIAKRVHPEIFMFVKL